MNQVRMSYKFESLVILVDLAQASMSNGELDNAKGYLDELRHALANLESYLEEDAPSRAEKYQSGQG